VRFFVSNIDYGATEQELEDFFQDFLDIKSIELNIDILSGLPKGSAYVNGIMFKPGHDINSLNGLEFMERVLNVEQAKK